jgi:hypothetical protein
MDIVHLLVRVAITFNLVVCLAFALDDWRRIKSSVRKQVVLMLSVLENFLRMI